MDVKEKEAEEEIKEKIEAEKKQRSSQNKTFRNFLIVMGFMAVGFLATWMLMNSTKHFTYRGVDFYIDKNEVQGLTLYRTSVPVGATSPTTGQVTKYNYNFYFRNDPRKLDKMPINGGNFTFTPNIILDPSANNFSCGGNGILALTEFSKMNLFGINLAKKNDSMNYSPDSDYSFLFFENGNSTSIDKIDANSYNIVINDCEIIPAIEKIMLERIVLYKERGN